MGAHLIDGEFQSDKYPTCPRGKVPLSVKDKTAQDLLWEYAQRRRVVDAEFSDDLETALCNVGFRPPTVIGPMKAYRVWVTMPDGVETTGSAPYERRERADTHCTEQRERRDARWKHEVREEVLPRDDARLGRVSSIILGDDEHWTEVRLNEKRPTNESVLAIAIRDVLKAWDSGEMNKAEFEHKMREVIYHFTRTYHPLDKDTEALVFVAKLAYQFKLRHAGFFIGGTKIQPFWDAIDDLPSGLTNEAHREMEAEIATWKADRPR
jgi:hypothetical protein